MTVDPDLAGITGNNGSSSNYIADLYQTFSYVQH